MQQAKYWISIEANQKVKIEIYSYKVLILIFILLMNANLARLNIYYFASTLHFYVEQSNQAPIFRSLLKTVLVGGAGSLFLFNRVIITHLGFFACIFMV